MPAVPMVLVHLDHQMSLEDQADHQVQAGQAGLENR